MQEDEVAYRAGQILAGKYKVERVLGIGGFGAVLAARHLQLEDRVAIKVLLPHAAKNQSASERFLREAKAAVRIRSEHVAKVTDVGQLEDGVPYMVMEYLDGTDLSSLVKAQHGQLVPDVAEWIIQACEAIAEAHQMGIIHRDLKPANLFLTRKIDGSPCVKVLDFGISKMQQDGGDKGMTKTSDVMGSPFYMSPEQMRSTRSVDVRSDIWALGTILFELLAGSPPFDAETMTALVVSIMQEPPRDLSGYRSDVPPAMRDVILRCLQKDPAMRFADVGELAEALAPFAPARAQASLLRIRAIIGRAQPTVRAVSDPGAGPTAIGMPTPTVPGEISGAVSSGGVAATRPGTLVSGSPGPAMTHASGPMSSALYQQSGNLAATASAPSQSWGGTYTGKKASSKLPVIVGVAALFVGIAGVGGFLYVRSNAGEGRHQTARVVDNPEAEKPAAASPPGDTTATPQEATPSQAQTTAPAVTPAPPAETPDDKKGKPGKGKPTSTPSSTPPPPTAQPTNPPPPQPPPTNPPPPQPPPTQKPPPGPFDTQN
ncbi:MAG: serine/threonine protein kinase [Myxococcales bacterium]|nr:serine/threonine protein kinase [Myxococcales bacterium]